jgi:hypothetical protein
MDPDRAVERILRLTLGLIAFGTVVYFGVAGWRGASGFLLGGSASYLGFRGLKRTVYSLGRTSDQRPPRASVAVFLGLRYLLLAAGAYAIVRFSEISLTAALVGLFAPAAAVILEILVELFYAGT